jgi:GNAT superfamily N-acetyltransferase
VKTTIRAADEKDAGAIADAWYAMMEEANLLRKTIPSRWRHEFIAALADGIGDGTQYWLVAQHDNRIVATGGAIVRRLEYAITPPRATIVGMYVWPPFRRHGIARAMLQRLVGFCRTKGVSEIRLQATASGQPLYASMGFVPSEEMVLRLRSALRLRSG